MRLALLLALAIPGAAAAGYSWPEVKQDNPDKPCTGVTTGKVCARDANWWTNNGKDLESRVGVLESAVGVTPGTLACTSIAPGSAAVGDSVVLSGSGFAAGDVVKLNGTTATATLGSSSQITAIVPNGATNGAWTVTAPSGSPTVTCGGSFTIGSAIIDATLEVPPWSATAPDGSSGNASVTQSGGRAVFTGTATNAFLVYQLTANPTLNQNYKLTATVQGGSCTTPWLQIQTYGTRASMSVFDLSTQGHTDTNGGVGSISGPVNSKYTISVTGQFTTANTQPPSGLPYLVVVGCGTAGTLYVDNSITLTASAPAPTVGSFTASPASINAGQSSTLSWTTTGASSVTIDNGIGAVAASGTQTVTPSATTTYTITATNPSGSTPATATVTVTPANTVAAPAFSPASGTYGSAQTVTMSDATSGAAIHYTYTTDGSTPAAPTCSSTTYTAAVATAGSGTTNFRAVGCKSGMTTSAEATASYTISTTGITAPGTGNHHAPQYITSITGAGHVSDGCKGSGCVANCPGSGCYTLPVGGGAGQARGDCSTDDTAAFRSAITAAGSLPLYVPKPPGACYKVTPGVSTYYSTLSLTHGIVGEAGKYPKIKMFGATGGGGAVGGNDSAAIVGVIVSTANQIISGIDFDGGGDVQGKIASYGGFPGGEPYASWAFDSCVGVIRSKNVTITDNFIHDCMGDAVEIEDDGQPSTTGNIAIVSNTMTDVTRQTLGIKGAGTSGTPGLFIADNILKATWGYGGVNDTEPNNSGDALWNYEMAWNACSQTTHTTGWNGTTINLDGAHLGGSGGNIYVHDNTPTGPDNFGHGWCLNAINPIFTNVHACVSPGN